MLNYSDYMDKEFTLNSSQGTTRFIRSAFDYNTRQRRALKSYPSSGVRLILEYWELVNFETFWSDLNDGTDTFYTTQVIFGDSTPSKQIRFVTGYTLSQIGATKHELTCQVELVRNGDPLAQACPLTPTPILMPREGLTPC